MTLKYLDKKMERSEETIAPTHSTQVCFTTPLASEATKVQRRPEVSKIFEHYSQANSQHPICRNIGANTQLCQVHKPILVKEKKLEKFEIVTLSEECSAIG